MDGRADGGAQVGRAEGQETEAVVVREGDPILKANATYWLPIGWRSRPSVVPFHSGGAVQVHKHFTNGTINGGAM